MHILILSHNEFISLTAVNLLASRLTSHKLTFAISDKVKVPSHLDPRLTALKSFDTKQLANISSYQHPLAPEQDFNSYQALAQNHDSELSILDQPHQESSLSWLKQLQPDLIVSIRYQRILRDHFINAAACPIINLHSGLLPEYRGVMPTFRAMLAGENRIGTSLHLISNSTIDTGDLISSSQIKTNYQDSYYQNTLNLYPSAIEMLAHEIQGFQASNQFSSKQQKGPIGYYSFPDTFSLDQFEQKGLLFF